MRRLPARRTVIVTAAVIGSLLGSGAVARAHPIGGRADLPVPVGLFAVVAGLALVAAFVGLTLRWTEPRLQEPKSRRVTRGAIVARLVVLMRVVGLAGLLTVVVAGLIDGGESPRNIAPVLVFICFWLVVPFLAAAVGDWWRWLSPWRTISLWVNRSVPEHPHLVERYGVWPAAVGLLAFGWFTFVSPTAARPSSLAIAAVVYTAYVVITGRLVGPHTGLRMFDAFHNSNAAIGAMAPLDVGEGEAPGTPRAGAAPGILHRGWLRGLPHLPQWPGFPALVLTLIGIAAYDGLTGTEIWIEATGQLRHRTWFATVTLVAVVVVLGFVYAEMTRWAARLVGGGETAARIARRFAHILVPIALAYMVAHYLTLVLYEGQLLLSSASDPFAQGWDLFGTAGWRIDFFMSSEVIWYLQVAAMASGQTAALVLSHDRALADYEPEGAARIQYAMLTLIVALTSLGLFLLSG